jgi:hypothetical protein
LRCSAKRSSSDPSSASRAFHRRRTKLCGARARRTARTKRAYRASFLCHRSTRVRACDRSPESPFYTGWNAIVPPRTRARPRLAQQAVSVACAPLSR